MSGLNWQINFDHCSNCVSLAPSSRQKLWTPLGTVFVEKKFWKKIWWGFRHIWVTPWKEFLISWKKWHSEIFWTDLPSRASVVHGLSICLFVCNTFEFRIPVVLSQNATARHVLSVKNMHPQTPEVPEARRSRVTYITILGKGMPYINTQFSVSSPL